MIQPELKNPFPFVGYFGPEYFCNREQETTQITRNIENGGSTTLISIRRMGKTGLIHHCIGMLPAGFTGIYVDILPTENLNQMLNLLATAIVRSVPEKSSIGKKLWDFIKSLRPVISFDPLTGEPQASFNIIKREEAEMNIHAVLQFLDNQNFKTIIAIDEFQQILNYPENNVDAWLRGIIQQLKQVLFIFSGSQQHLMAEIFSSPNRPFFRSTLLMQLEPIETESYADFLMMIFAKHNKLISRDIVYNILHWCNYHTYYVQLLCNRIFSYTGTEVSATDWKNQANELINESEPVFMNYRSLLTKSQWQLLKALSTEDKVYQPSATDFMLKNQLGGSATVIRSLQSLQKYEFIYSGFEHTGEKYYSVYDVFFKQWVRKMA